MSDPLGSATERGALLEAADAERADAFGAMTSVRRTLPLALWSALLVVVALVATGEAPSGFAVAVPVWAVIWWALARVVPGPLVLRHVVGGLAGAGVAALLASALDARSAEVREDALLVVGAVVAVLVVGATVAWWRDSLVLERRWRRTRSVLREPWARALPVAQVPPHLAQVHDVRDRPDLADAVAAGPLRQALRHGYGLRTMVPFVLLAVQGVVGLVALGAGFLDGRSHDAAGLVLGVVLVGPFLAVAVRSTLVWPQTAYGELQRVAAEASVLLAGRGAAHGTTGRPVSAAASMRSPLFVGVMVLFVALVLYRARDAGPLLWGLALGLVLVGFLLTLLALLRRSREVRVYPLLGVGPDLRQEPARRVEVALDGDDVVLTAVGPPGGDPVRVAVADVLAVVDLKPAFLQPRGVGLALRDGVPLVLVGGGVRDHPAVRRLRS